MVITFISLVASYLLHNGFLESAQALGKWVTKAKSSLSESSIPSPVMNGSKTTSSENLVQNGFPSDLKKGNTNSNKLPLGHLNGFHTTALTNGMKNGPIPTSNGYESKSNSIPNGNGHPQSDQSVNVSNGTSDESKDFGLGSLFSWPEAAELLLKRRQLRDTIRAGDYVSALCQLETYFKSLWEKDPSIAFVLWCHHFIDMIARHYTNKDFDDHSCCLSPAPTSSNRETIQPCSLNQCSNSSNGLRSSQKRVKPSNSLESSPEVHDSLQRSITNRIHSDMDELASDHALSTGNHRLHEHSPTTCQAPVRLRLEASKRDDGGPNDPSSSSSVQLPVYPPHCMCYRDNRTRSSETVNDSTRQIYNGSSNCDGSYPRAHSFCETGKRERRFPQAMRRASCSSMDLDSGPGGVEAAVGLLDPTHNTNWNLGNGLTRSKCLTVIRRSGRFQASNGHSLSPNPVRASSNCCMHSSLLAETKPGSNPVDCNFHLPQSLLSGGWTDLSSGDATNCSSSIRCTTTTTSAMTTITTSTLVNQNSNGHHRSSSPLTTSPPIKSDPIYDLLVNGYANSTTPTTNHTDDGDMPKENGLLASDGCCSYQNPSDQSQSDAGRLVDLIKFGRSLRSSALDLQRQGVITTEQLLLLTSAFSLIAYQNPYASPMNGLLHPRHRELLADAVNDAVLAHLNQPSRPVLDTALNYFERALIGDATSALTAQLHSVPVYRFNSSSVGNETPNSNSGCGQSSNLGLQESCHRFSESLPVSSRDLLSPITRTSSSVVNSPRDAETHSLLTDIQTNSGRSRETEDNPTNDYAGLSRPASASVVSSSLYVPPSALLSLGSHSYVLTRTQSIQRSSSQRSRPTSLQNLLHHRRQSQSSSEPHYPRQPQEMRGLSPSNRTANASSQWPVPSPTSTITTTATVQPRMQSPSSRLTVASLTNTHTPTGPELAGFYHPILFID